MLGDEPLQVGHGFGGPAEGQLAPQAVLGDTKAQLVEATSLGAGELGSVEPGVGRPPPERERLGEGAVGAVRPALGQGAAAHRRETGETLGIDLPVVDGEAVAGTLGEQEGRGEPAVDLEGVAQAHDEGLEGLRCAGRWLLAPEGVDEVTGRDEPPGRSDEAGEQEALLGAPDLDLALRALDT